jgi:isoleucyl-tRNA synthetase
MCFSAQDVADDLLRQTGTPFDVHGQVWPSPAQVTEKRWEKELRPCREAVLAKLEAFRAVGHKALEANVTVTPAAAERDLWKKNQAHLTELCEVARIEISSGDTTATEIVVTEAPGPECPRCWRHTGAASGHVQDPNLCIRCASVVSSLVTS